MMDGIHLMEVRGTTGYIDLSIKDIGQSYVESVLRDPGKGQKAGDQP